MPITLDLPNRRLALLAGAFFVAALVLQLPGNVPYDGIVVWHEAVTHTLYAQHPAALVLIWRLCQMVLPGPALFTAFSLGVLWLAVAILLLHHRPPLWAALAFCIVMLLWPPLFATAGVTVKDVLGAHLVLLAFALADGKRPGAWFVAFAATTLSFLLRYQFGLFLPVLGWMWWKQRDRPTAFAALAGVAVTVVAVNILVAALFARTGPNDVEQSLRKIAIFDIAGTLAHDPSAPLTVFAKHGVDTVELKREMAEQYSPVRVDTLWQAKDASGTITPASGVFGRLYPLPNPVIFDQWRSIVRIRPAAFLAHRSAAFARVIGLGDIWQCRPVTAGISWLPRPAATAINAKAISPPLSAEVMTSRYFPVSLSFRAAAYLVLLLAVLLIGPAAARPLAVFALLYELSFYLLPQACEVRYAYPAMLAAIVGGAMTVHRYLYDYSRVPGAIGI